MKISIKILFFLVFAVFLTACGGEKENVYDEYAVNDDADGANQAENGGSDRDSDKETSDNIENAADDEDKTGEENDFDDSGMPDDDKTDDDTDDETDGDSGSEQPDAAEEDDEDEDDEYELVDCTGFSLDPEEKFSGSVPATTYSVQIEGNMLGDPEIPDWFELRIDHHRVETDPYVAVGTYDLEKRDAMQHNSKYWTCLECASVFQDRNTDGEKFFFQKKGTLTIYSVDLTCSFTALLSVKLIESDFNGGFSTPVKHGECLEIETAIEAHTSCTPDCNQKECGANDGCCGTCGKEPCLDPEL